MYLSNFFIKEKKNMNQSMTSQGSPKIVQIHMGHPVRFGDLYL